MSTLAILVALLTCQVWVSTSRICDRLERIADAMERKDGAA